MAINSLIFRGERRIVRGCDDFFAYFMGTTILVLIMLNERQDANGFKVKR